MTTPYNPTADVAAGLIRSHGVPSDPCMDGLRALFSNEVAGDPDQLERLLILSSELMQAALTVALDDARPAQHLAFGLPLFKCHIAAVRELADVLGVPL